LIRVGFPGRGNTEGDLIVVIPDSKILMTGDLVVHPYPYVFGSFIGEWIVDFACTKVRLVVEVDGPYHEERVRPDAARDRALRQLGWSVLRVAEQVWK
jgi:glyoxylase-like metal-dependent hydrolase (beta-lactamase superfamily II)